MNRAQQRNYHLGSGWVSVGKAVASHTRGPRFKPSGWQTLYYLYTVNCTEKTKIKNKRLRIANFKKKQPSSPLHLFFFDVGDGGVHVDDDAVSW